jgi:type III pantothenate kinase
MNSPSEATGLIAVDVGNRHIKCGIVKSYDPHRCQVDWQERLRWPWSFAAPPFPSGRGVWVVSSVNDARWDELRLAIRQQRPADEIQRLDHRHVPLRIEVDAPERVGMDRLCAAAAADAMTDCQGAIVIDAGTAITVDAVGNRGEFLGGTIFLGIQGEFDQLATVAAALPHSRTDELLADVTAIGKNTRQSLESGVLLSKAGGIQELVRRITARVGGQPDVFLTGGDAGLLQPWLALKCRHIDDLVLSGVVRVAAASLGSNVVVQP